MTIVLAALLTLLVGLVWLACAGFARLRTPLDRLHCATFVNVAAGAVLVAIGFAADGLSTRSIKILLAMLAGILGGAALSHAAGRALQYRSSFNRSGKIT